MNFYKLTQRMLKSLVISFCFLPLIASSAVSQLVTFGDSLSDAGNLFNITTSLSAFDPLMPIIPHSPPYSNGRFSNGNTWIEALALALSLDLNDRDEFNDYAFGGSWVEPPVYSGEYFPPGLTQQVDWYLNASSTSSPRPNHVYTIWDGANDYLNGRSDVEAATTNTVSIIKSNIIRLINSAGAQNFLLLNLPDLGRTPYATLVAPSLITNLTQLTVSHNQKIQQMVTELQAAYPTRKFMLLDIYADFNTILNTGSFGGTNFTNTTMPCYTGGYFANTVTHQQMIATAKEKANIDLDANPALMHAFKNGVTIHKATTCGVPSDYAFWDTLHPTTTVHALLGTEAHTLLQANGL